MTAGTDWVPDTQFAQARGARLAYQEVGGGEHRILAIPPLAQNIEIAWEWPEVRAMLERFATFSHFVPFDKRGTGASDRIQVPGIDERVEDIRAVMDAVGFDDAYFFVQSEGGPMAIMFAATYPDRVRGLIFHGSFAALAPPWSEEERIERQELFISEWGTPASRMIDRFAPSMAANQEYRTWHQRYERLAATPDSLRDLLNLSAEMDVREILPQIDVPTLVIQATGDLIVSFDRAQELVDNIPGARLFTYESDDHYAYVGDLDRWMIEVERFVTGTTKPQATQRREPSPARITTLGRFAVEVNGEEIATSAWGSRNARQVCKRLVAARGWPVTRDELIDMLWPDEDDRRRLSARLSVQLSAVRKVLGGGVIADRESVRLDPEEVETDLEAFYQATDDTVIAAAYAGDFLPEDRYEDWTGAPRDEARSRFVAAARRATELAIGNRNFTYATETARRVVEADRYNDNSHLLLVNALMEAGEEGEARNAHVAWQAAMAELDIEVSSFEQVVGS